MLLQNYKIIKFYYYKTQLNCFIYMTSVYLIKYIDLCILTIFISKKIKGKM